MSKNKYDRTPECLCNLKIKFVCRTKQRVETAEMQILFLMPRHGMTYIKQYKATTQLKTYKPTILEVTTFHILSRINGLIYYKTADDRTFV